MPEMDGLQALEEICPDRPLPAILVSAYSDEDLVRRAEENYVMAYLVKPVKQAESRRRSPWPCGDSNNSRP